MRIHNGAVSIKSGMKWGEWEATINGYGSGGTPLLGNHPGLAIRRLDDGHGVLRTLQGGRQSRESLQGEPFEAVGAGPTAANCPCELKTFEHWKNVGSHAPKLGFHQLSTSHQPAN